MNALELADYLQNKAEVELNPRLQESATMLRQQQAEIEVLKGEVAQLKHMNKNWSISEGWALEENKKLQAEIEVLKAEIDRLVNHSRTWTPFD